MDLRREFGIGKQMFLDYSPWPVKVVRVSIETQTYRVFIPNDPVAEWYDMDAKMGPASTYTDKVIHLKEFAFNDFYIGPVRCRSGFEPETGTFVTNGAL